MGTIGIAGEVNSGEMPGIVGFVGWFSDGLSGVFIEKMAHALEPDDHFKIDLFQEGMVGLGRITLGNPNPERQPIWNEDETLCLVMEGEIYDYEPIKQNLLLHGHRFRYNNDAELLLHLYEEEGKDFAVNLNGAFVAAIWDRQANKILVVNDRFGLYPQYYALVNRRLIFASGVRALLVDPSLPHKTDCIAIAEFLTFDHILDDRTLLEAVRLLPPASILEYSDGKLQIKPYWKLRYADPYPVRSEQDYTEEFLHLLHQAVARRAHHGSLQSGILLSGGLDSRFILAFLSKVLKPQTVYSFTWGIPGCNDLRYAREVSIKTGARHTYYELKPDWLLEKAGEAVRITDGMGNLVNLHALATLEAEARNVQVLYKGFMGDALMGFGQRHALWTSCDVSSGFSAGLQVFNDLGLITFKLEEHNALFTNSFLNNVGRAVFEGFVSGLRSSDSLLPNDQVNYFYLSQRVPRMTVMGVELVRTRTIARLPYADNDLVEFSLRLLPGFRLERRLMKNALIQAFPQLAQIPLTEAGLPLMICARDVQVRTDRVLRWHLNSMGLKWISTEWRRPYKDYALWFRTVLRNWVEETLLNPHALARGYYNSEYIRKLVAEHMAGTDHAVALGALLSVEIWHRMYLDQDKVAIDGADRF